MSSPCAARPRRWPEGQLSPRAGSMSPSQSAISRWGLGFPHRARRYRPGGYLFSSPGCWSLRGRKDFSSGDETLSSPGAEGSRCWPEGPLSTHAGSMSLSQSATSQWGSSFHTVRGGIDPGDLRFRPRAVGVVRTWKYVWSGDGKLSSPGAAGHRRWPKGNVSPRAGSMSPSQSATSQWGSSFHTVRGGIDPGDLRFRSRDV